MKVYHIIYDDGRRVPITDATAHEVSTALNYGEYIDSGDGSKGEAEWNEQARIVLSLKGRGLL